MRVGQPLAQYAGVIAAPPCPLSDTSSRLVRYRFDSTDDLYRHLRVKHGFFVPARALLGEPGQRAIVEVGLPGAGDRPLLHGSIAEQSAGGVWLTLPAARAASRWVPGPDSPRRRHRRVACDLFVEVQSPGAQPFVCRVIDLSARGLRVTAASLELGIAGDEVAMTLLPAGDDGAQAILGARVAWAGGREAGLEILRADNAFSAIVAAAEARWTGVREIVHDLACICATPARRAG